MQSYYIKPKAFYDSFGDVQPSQPYSYTYGDRPTFSFSFLPNEIAEGDTLIFAVDNDMVFYDSTPENLLHSASCMVVVRHDVTAEEATAGKVQIRIETRTAKFRDVTNGKVRPVEVISGLYRKRGSNDDINYVLLAMGRAFANGIIADYNALPEPITTDEYYTKDEIDDKLDLKADKSSVYTKGETDGLLDTKANVATTLSGYGIQDAYTKTETDDKLDAKADKADLVAHTDNSDIHVTQQEKTEWSKKADRNDIGTATITITQGGTSKGSFSVNASENVTIEVNDGAQADWDETDTTSPAYIKNRPSVYTKTETNSLLDAKADKATTIAGYGITDAYTKDEVDAKVASVYHYKGTVSAYADLPASGQEVGDVWNIETADSSHGIKAGDNVAWTGSEWDALAGEIDLSAYATKTELETKLDAPATGTVGQVLTKTADGQEWADAPAGGEDPDVLDALDNLNYMLESHVGAIDDKDFFHVTALEDGTFTYRGMDTGNKKYEYSFDRRKWYEVILPFSIFLEAGKKIWLRNTTENLAFDIVNTPIVTHTGAFSVGGKILSLASKSIDETATFGGALRMHSVFEKTNITAIDTSFTIPTFVPMTSNMFSGCTSLASLPDGFTIPDSVTNVSSMFSGCTSLASLPDGFTIPDSVTNVSSMFSGCTSLASLPDGFTIPDSVTNVSSMFHNCNNIKTIGNNVSINPSTDNEGAINRNNITSIGTGFSYKTSYTTSISSGQAVFPNATIGAGYHIYQYSDAQ